jgi:hypothetical protein
VLEDGFECRNASASGGELVLEAQDDFDAGPVDFELAHERLGDEDAVDIDDCDLVVESLDFTLFDEACDELVITTDELDKPLI